MNIVNNNAASGGGDQFTSAPVAPVAGQQLNEPEFYAMPGPGQVLEGLRRGALYCLWHDGEIETIAVRRKGKTRGRRLIVAESLKNYLRHLRQEQCASPQAKGSTK